MLHFEYISYRLCCDICPRIHPMLQWYRRNRQQFPFSGGPHAFYEEWSVLLKAFQQYWANWIFLLQEQVAEPCHFSSSKGWGRGRWVALKGQTSAQLPHVVELPSHMSCDSSSNLAFQDFSIGGVVLVSFALPKVFVCRLDPTWSFQRDLWIPGFDFLVVV